MVRVTPFPVVDNNAMAVPASDAAPAAVRAALAAHRATLTSADQLATFDAVERLVVRSYVATVPLATHPFATPDGAVHGDVRRNSKKRPWSATVSPAHTAS